MSGNEKDISHHANGMGRVRRTETHREVLKSRRREMKTSKNSLANALLKYSIKSRAHNQKRRRKKRQQEKSLVSAQDEEENFEGEADDEDESDDDDEVYDERDDERDTRAPQDRMSDINKLHIPFWDPYDAINQQYLEIGQYLVFLFVSSNQTQRINHVLNVPLGSRADIRSHYRGHKLSIWLNLIPQLHSPNDSPELTMKHHNFLEDSAQYYDGLDIKFTYLI